MNSSMTKVKPFLKWAGGKSQLLDDIARVFPNDLVDKNFTYVEPFVGSGAVLFWVLNTFADRVERVVINDVNADLINTYQMIKDQPQHLIECLKNYQDKFIQLDHKEAQKEYYYEQRALYNSRQSESLIQAALFIFLNRTCFNGLYRVNRKNEFNVPMGDYKKPLICDAENLLNVSKALQCVEILCGDYQQVLPLVEGNKTWFYFDPPYRPLSETSSFNAYAKDTFDDEAQIRLASFCKKLDEMGYYWVLSNSDPKNIDENDHFFDALYSDFHIQRVLAKRAINAKADKRGQLNELLIRNYKDENEKEF